MSDHSSERLTGSTDSGVGRSRDVIWSVQKLERLDDGAEAWMHVMTSADESRARDQLAWRKSLNETVRLVRRERPEPPPWEVVE